MGDGDAQRPNEPPGNMDELTTACDRAVDKGADGPGRHDDASHRTPSFCPIVSERVLHRFELLSQRHRVQARTGLVLVNSRSEHHSFPPERWPTMGELFWKGPGMLYEVDMGLHWTSLELDLPSSAEAFLFSAVVDVEWRVDDPVKVVRDGVNDVREALLPSLHHRLSTITRQFDVEDTAAAEAAALKSLSDDPVGGDYGLSSRIFIRMRMDMPTVNYALAIRDVQREIEIERETQALRLLREESTTMLISRRVERYRAIILAGDYDQFALQLAHNPDEMPTVVQMLRDERHNNRRDVIDFVTRLFDSGVIERYEIDDQVRAALDWLKVSTDTVLRGPDQPAIPGQTYSHALPPTEIPESSLPNTPRVDPVGPPGGASTHGAGKS